MSVVFNRNRLSTAVLLCGGQSSLLSPLVSDMSVCMLPVFNRHLLKYTIDFLADMGLKKIIVSASQGDIDVFGFVNGLGGSNVQVECFQEDRPRGTAGALCDLRGRFGDESFLVLDGNIFLDGLDLGDILADHYNRDSALTIGVRRIERSSTEGISVDDDGEVKGFSVFHSSRDRRSSYKPMGIYVFSPLALDFITEKGFFDIKEQLIPALKNASMPVHIFEIEGNCRPISSVEDYFEIHRESLLNGDIPRGRMQEIDEGVWAGEGINISPDAHIVGPAFIGSNSIICANAQIIGPAVIGENCVIGKGAKIRESILWNDIEMEKDSSISYSIAGNGLRVSSGDSFMNKIIVDALSFGDLNMMPSKYEFNGVVEAEYLRIGSLKYALYMLIKRSFDLAASVSLLMLLSPLMLLIAIAVKFGSEGPVIYSQKRSGKGGRDFSMLKFRTMVKDAHSQQQKLSALNKVDGPMFKVENDPRITRIGRLLRGTSLDELPQLVNVIKGEMSLVGPRPLVMGEMKFSPSWRSIRLKVRPGITGMWQVQGRSEAPFHDWIRHDIFYVRNQSLLLDIRILIKTFSVVLRKLGAY
ncbi:MAG: sugar transferase [Deltaproteobacteria bacterium]|nr:sugar transferase [Deltaproteobacteria bacterium]